MLREQGLGDAPVFSVPESHLTEDGLLPSEEVRALRGWLYSLADDADARPGRLAHHGPEPVRIDDFHVVVQEQQQIARCRRRAGSGAGGVHGLAEEGEEAVEVSRAFRQDRLARIMAETMRSRRPGTGG